VDSISQWMNLVYIAMGPEDIGKIRVGSLNPFTIEVMKDLKKFFGTVFKMTVDKGTRSILISGLGIGQVNVNKSIT
jgi:RNA 3'-terminal phosphate cyclase-like protein